MGLGPLFTEIVSFLSERREEGRKENKWGEVGGMETGVVREEGETSTKRKCPLTPGSCG